MVKARGWWPGTWSSSKTFFWQFVFPSVDLALLKPMKNFPWEKCVVQATKKQGEKLFLLWRHSALLARPFSWLAKNRRQGNPCRYAGDWSIRYGALCRSKLLSPALRGSLVSPRIIEKATENELYASGKFCLLSLFLSLSLSLSLRVSTLEKRSVPAQHSWSKQKFAKPQFQVYSGLRVQHAAFELRAGRGQRRCHDCRIEYEPRGSTAD